MKVPRSRSSGAITITILLMLAGVSLSPAAARRVNRPGDTGGPGDPRLIYVYPGTNLVGAAIAQSPAGGEIILKTGQHTESGTLIIDHPVTLRGEPGAVLEVFTLPATSYPMAVHPALHVRDTHDVLIEGLEIRPPVGFTGGAAILIERSAAVTVTGNAITGHQFGTLVQHGEGVRIAFNTFAIEPGGLEAAAATLTSSSAMRRLPGDTDPPTGKPQLPPGSYGIALINGDRALVEGNLISGATIGLWVSGDEGQALGNTLTGNREGMRLCCVAPGHFMISGSDEGSTGSARRWLVRGNLATRNAWGFVAMRADDNQILDNLAGANSLYDIELTGPTPREGNGFLMPASSYNRVCSAGRKTLVVKDCGVNNKVCASSRLVDNGSDLCR